MEDQNAVLRGIFERNVAALDDPGGGYHLNHVTIELDLSEANTPDEGAEGLPVSVEGRFETREHPESGTRFVFVARRVRQGTPVDEGGEPSGAASESDAPRRAVPPDAPRTESPPPRTGDAPPSPSEQPPPLT